MAMASGSSAGFNVISSTTSVLGVWVVQLIASPIWRRHFRFGPLEWLWRSLTYVEIQPMRRRPHVAAERPNMA